MDTRYKKDIEAYADGEMDYKQSKNYKETLDEFPVLQDYLRKLDHQKKLLRRWWVDQKHH